MSDVQSSLQVPPERPLQHMHDHKFVWFYNPIELSEPYNVRELLFAAVVCHLGYQSCGYPVNAKRVHDYLTLLLRGWNPITAWTLPRAERQTDEHYNDPLFEDCVQPLFKVLLDFDRSSSMSDRYRYLAYFSRLCEDLGKDTSDSATCERFTLTSLAMWLLTRRLPEAECLDAISLRACMDLHYRDLTYATTTIGQEYLFYTDLAKASWLHKQVERLMRSSEPTSLVVDQIVYLAWFLSLVRARRMFEQCVATNPTENLNQAVQTEQLKESVNELVHRQIYHVRQLIDHLPQRVIEPDDFSKLPKFLNVFGIKPRKKGN